MTVRPATSTPRPLPREREYAEKNIQLSLADAVATHAMNDIGSGQAPATTIQINEAPLARRKSIQRKERETDPRLATLVRIRTLCVEIQKLGDVIALGADIELLDLMRNEAASLSAQIKQVEGQWAQ